MTKSIRIENADTSRYKVRVELHERVVREDSVDDVIVKEVDLDYPTMMTDMLLHSGRYIVIRENGERESN